MPGLCLGLLSMGCWQQDWGVRVPSRAAGPTPAHTCRVYRPARLHRAPSALFPASQRGLLPGCSGGAVTVQNRQRTALVSRWCEHGDGGSRPLPGAASQFGRHRCIPDPGHGCIYPPAVTPGAADSIRASHRPSWWHQPSARVWKLFLASLWPRNNISEKNQSLHVVFCFLVFFCWCWSGRGARSGSGSLARAAGRVVPWRLAGMALSLGKCVVMGWHPAWGAPHTAALYARGAEQQNA